MARPLRIEYPGAWYHVMNRGRHREVIFRQEHDFRLFLELLGRSWELFDLETHAYALMSNHYHLLVRTPQGNLSRGMRHLDGVFAQTINRKYKLEGSLFRGRFKSTLIEQDSYLLEVVRYIHRNPLKASLETALGQYPWTSYRAYLQGNNSFPWLHCRVVLRQFAAEDHLAKRAFETFVNRRLPEEVEIAFDKKRCPAILGGKSFQAWVRKTFLEYRDDSEIPQLREVSRWLTAGDLLQIACQQLGWNRAWLQKGMRTPTGSERRGFVYLCRRHLKLPYKQISPFLGQVSISAVSKQYRLAEEEIRRRKGCYSLVLKLETLLKTEDLRRGTLGSERG